MMYYKQPVSDLLEKAQNLLKSIISGMEHNNISVSDAFNKLKQLEQYQGKIKNYIDIEKE